MATAASSPMADMADLQEMVDSICLGGSQTVREMDDLAAAIQNKLQVDLGKSAYQQMAKKMVDLAVKEKPAARLTNSHDQSRGRMPQPSGGAGSGRLGTVSGSSASGRSGFGGMAGPPMVSSRRGRSPARSGPDAGNEVPTKTPVRRARTPTRGLFGGAAGSKIPLHSPNTANIPVQAAPRPHNRSPSPFSRFNFGRKKVQEEKKEERPAPPVVPESPSRAHQPRSGRESPRPDEADTQPVMMRNPRPSPDRPSNHLPSRSGSPFSRAGLQEDDDDDSVSQPTRAPSPAASRRSRSLTPRFTRPNAAHDMDSEQPEIPRSRSKSPFMGVHMSFGAAPVPAAAAAPTPRAAVPTPMATTAARPGFSPLDQDPTMTEATPMSTGFAPRFNLNLNVETETPPVAAPTEPIYTPMARNADASNPMSVDPSNKTGDHKLRRKGTTPTFAAGPMPSFSTKPQPPQPVAPSFGFTAPPPPPVAPSFGFTAPPPPPVAPSFGFTAPQDNGFKVDLKSKQTRRRGQPKRHGGGRRNVAPGQFADAAIDFSSSTAAPAVEAPVAARAAPSPVAAPEAAAATPPLAHTKASEFSFGTAKQATTPRNNIFSPMDFEPTAPSPTPPPPPPPPLDPTSATDAGIQFNIGIAASPRGRLAKGRARHFGRKANETKAASKASRGQPPQETAAAPSFSAFSMPANLPKTVASDSRNEDLTARVALVESLKEEAKSLYLVADYRSSVHCYTKAIRVFAECNGYLPTDTLAVLLSNRGAGLMMLGADEAASADCRVALGHVTPSIENGERFSEDGGLILKSKLYTRLGRSLLKQGNHTDASTAFEDALTTANDAISLSRKMHDAQHFQQNQGILSQAIGAATLGKTDAHKLQTAWDQIALFTLKSLRAPSNKQHYVDTLSHVNEALRAASGSLTLWEHKVKLLGSLKRWREIGSFCERLAANNARLDNVFVHDLESRYPFPGVPPAKVLTANFFGDTTAEDVTGADLKLNSAAVAEAVVRLPYSLMPYYARALRLEERYPAAETAAQALDELANRARLLPKFNWLMGERSKLSRTKLGRERGDQLFRAGDFQQAAAQYSAVLTIDADRQPGANVVESAGGRLHAVLHCNRGACFMALNRYQEALDECSAALRIHSRYMKAMLRRSRCYGRLQRYQEAIAEYKRWLQLVDEAKTNPRLAVFLLSPCLFDLPRDATNAEITQVKRELDDMYATKRKAEATAREETSRRQDRERYQNTFNQSQGAQSQGEAHRRREGWYNQQDDNRRWDSFSGRGPRSQSWREPRRPQQKEQSSRRRAPSVGSPGSDLSKCHYSVLDIRTNASLDQIKKGYRKMALKFHPDKNSDASAPETFRRVKLAYEVLNDTNSKHTYDSSRGYRNF